MRYIYIYIYDCVAASFSPFARRYIRSGWKGMTNEHAHTRVDLYYYYYYYNKCIHTNTSMHTYALYAYNVYYLYIMARVVVRWQRRCARPR